MLKEFAEYLIKKGSTEVLEVNKQNYSTEPLHLVKKPTPLTIKVKNLAGLVDYIQSEFDGTEPLMIHVESPTKVRVFSQTNADEERDHVIQAEAMIPDFDFDRFYNTEEFNIKLQSCFVPNDDRDVMLKVVGNIREEGVQEFGDDGTSQAVTARTGVASVGNVVVPNPVKLAPRRTFVEVEQPKSDYVFRMRSGPTCALFEADGGAWKLEAMNSIADFLESSLAKQVEADRIHIIS